MSRSGARRSPFTPPSAPLTRPLLTGSFGMAATTHWIPSAVAQAVLERGGNAYDAAVAAGFVLHLAEPHLNGAGGDLVGLISPAGGTARVVVGQGPAPARATIEHYRSLGLESVPGAGALAAAVPGAVPAWLWLLREHGTWDIADALDYAIHYAEAGQPLLASASATIASVAGLFAEHWPTSAATWLVDGQAPPPGHVVKQPVYARTLRRLLEAAQAAGGDRIARIDAVDRAWSSGFVAKAIAQFAARPHRHSDGGDYAGVIDPADLAGFQIATEEPLRLTFRGTTVAKAGFWAQGPVLLQALAILDQVDDADLDPSTERGAHTVIEAVKLAMADRDAYYGDVRGDHELLRHLLTPQYARSRAALITGQASGDWRPGQVPGITPYFPPLRTLDQLSEARAGTAGTGEPTVRLTGETRGDTVHLDIVDSWGNFISVTPSGGWLQSNPTIPELGFCLGTRLQMTWLDPESPSALRPGTRPRTTLSPTILERDGAAVSALGTPGGDQQDQWQLLYLLRRLVGGYNPQQAIEAPMLTVAAVAQSFWPREWTPRGVLVEDRLGADVIEGLRRRGHEVKVLGPWSLGRLSAVERDPGTALLSAAANPRGAQGYAAGRLRAAQQTERKPVGYDLIDYAETPLGRIAFHQTGSGEPLILSHGGESHKGQYAPLAPLLADGIRAVSYDQRDIADSFTVAEPYTMAQVADDVVRLMDALGLEKAHIAGFSYGGLVSLNVAVHHPDRVQTLIAGTSPDNRRPPSEFLQGLFALDTAERTEAMIKAVLSEKGQLDPVMTATARTVISGGYTRPGSHRLAAMATHNVGDKLAGITAPTLLIYGSDDPIAPPEDGAALAADIPGARLAVVEGARHGIYWEFKEEAARLINDFVAAHPVQPGS